MAHLSGGVVALLDTLTFPETITILVIALIVLGPDKLPGMARSIGNWMNKLKKMSANLQAEVREVMDDPQMQPLRELGEFAAQPKKKLAEYAMAAEAEVDRAEAMAVPAKSEEPAEDADATDAGTTDADAAAAESTEGDAVDPDGADGVVRDPGAVGQTIEDEIAATEAEMDAAELEAEAEIEAAEARGDVVPADPTPAEHVHKVVATGPNHPMERQSPEPHALDS